MSPAPTRPLVSPRREAASHHDLSNGRDNQSSRKDGFMRSTTSWFAGTPSTGNRRPHSNEPDSSSSSNHVSATEAKTWPGSILRLMNGMRKEKTKKSKRPLDRSVCIERGREGRHCQTRPNDRVTFIILCLQDRLRPTLTDSLSSSHKASINHSRKNEREEKINLRGLP